MMKWLVGFVMALMLVAIALQQRVIYKQETFIQVLVRSSNPFVDEYDQLSLSGKRYRCFRAPLPYPPGAMTE